MLCPTILLDITFSLTVEIKYYYAKKEYYEMYFTLNIEWVTCPATMYKKLDATFWNLIITILQY